MGSQPIFFPSETFTCEGILMRSEQGPQAPGLVICHPHPLYGGDMENNVVRALARAFTAVGFGVLRFNFRGVGRSTGHYGEGIGEQEDAKAALTCLKTQPGIDAEQLFLAGYSFGARVTLAVAATDSRVQGFIAVAPPVLRGPWPPLGSSRGPKVFLSGDRDPYAPPEVLTDLVESLPEPRRLVVLPDTDHFFVGQEHTLAQNAVKLLQELS
ncbi:MAG TPA: alpha/beta fold hydrolase [Candidatus Tectomicrobia bacterium]|nr:alpha/beta fold hydrolase [Candidatus Tectomicrobia bacterium]